MISGADCVSPGIPSCAESGTYYDPASGKCVGTDRPKCGEGFFPSGDRCVSPGSPQCSRNFALDARGRCISVYQPICPDNSMYVAATQSCVSSEQPKCPDGQLDGNGHCVHGAPECPAETALIDGVCVSNKTPKCPGDTHLDDVTGKCIAVEPPTCPEGTTLQGELCVAAPPRCPEGTELRGTRCVSTAQAKCGHGLVFREDRNDCVSEDDPKCQEGTVYDPAGRRCTTVSRQACFDLRTCPPVEDSIPRLPQPSHRQEMPRIVDQAPVVTADLETPAVGEEPAPTSAEGGETQEGQGSDDAEADEDAEEDADAEDDDDEQ